MNLPLRKKELLPELHLSLIEQVVEKTKVEQVVKLILDTAVDSRRWENALEEIRRYLDAEAVNLAEYDFEWNLGRIQHAVGYSQLQLQEYEEIYSSINIWLLHKQGWYIEGKVGRGGDLLASDEMVKSSFYQKWLKPLNIFHRVCAVVNQKDQRVFYLEAVRSESQGAFSDRAIFFLRGLVPYLKWTTRCNDLFWKLILTKDVLDQLSFMVIVVDKHTRPLFMNRVAYEILEENDGLYLSQDSLCVSELKEANRLKTLVKDTASSTNSGRTGGVIKIQRRERPPLWMVISPLSRKLRKVIGQVDEVALVYGHAPGIFGVKQQSLLETFYGMTPAEQRVALLIMQGYKLGEAADRLAISGNTLRTHLKRIYVKTNTNRQSDLVRVLLTGPWNQKLDNEGSVIVM